MARKRERSSIGNEADQHGDKDNILRNEMGKRERDSAKERTMRRCRTTNGWHEKDYMISDGEETFE